MGCSGREEIGKNSAKGQVSHTVRATVLTFLSLSCSEQRYTRATTYLDSSLSCMRDNLFGIDHDALNKQIIEYKKMTKDKEIEGVGLSEQQKQQLAEIQKRKKVRWKKAKKPFDDGITPQKYLMDKYSEDDWDSDTASSHELENELEDELQEMEDRLEVDNSTTEHK